jgi:hypothetical protein
LTGRIRRILGAVDTAPAISDGDVLRDKHAGDDSARNDGDPPR